MAKQSYLIKDLDITKKNCTLTARATRIWEVNYKSENLKPDSMDMMLVDEQGDQIQATVRKDLIKDFKEVLHEELIGQLIGIENKIYGHVASSNRRTIHIRDDKDETIIATLWGDRADLVQDEIPNLDQPQIIIITATRVIVYKGAYQLNSTGATKIYTNLNIPKVHAFRQVITNIPPTEIAQIQVAQPETLEQSMAKTKTTIRELQELQMTNDEDKDLNATYTCVGRIVMVLEDECGWRYRSCNVCKSKIDDSEYCSKCEFNPPFPIDRFRLVVTLHDGEASLNVGLFDKDVEKVVGKPMAAMDKLSKQPNGAQKVSKELQQCVGKECTLKVRLNTNGYIQDLIATKVLDVQNKGPTLRPKAYKPSHMELEADMALAIKRSLKDDNLEQSKKRTASDMAAYQGETGQSSTDLSKGKNNNSEDPSDKENHHDFQENEPNNRREGKQIDAGKATAKMIADKKQRIVSSKTSSSEDV